MENSKANRKDPSRNETKKVKKDETQKEEMIIFEKEPYSSEEIFAIMENEIREWFRTKYNDFTPPQRYAIINIHNKENVLISSPTGSGKTLSAFLAILNELFKLAKENKLEDKIYAIYISPLKALGNDIKRNLIEPLKEIEELSKIKHNIRVAIRNSDTPASEKSKMLRKPPHILITTPESFVLGLTSKKFKEKMKDAKWVIVDEIHSLAENKRGALLMLGIERLNYYTDFVRIGLSATVHPLKEVARFLVGNRKCKIVDVQFTKQIEMKVITPVKDIINTDFETIHKEMYKKIHELIQKHKTTLIFTNTRSATERVIYHLKTMFNYKDDEIGAHHSSLSKLIRENIEERLKGGKLKVVVSSTSLELGIDIGSIDLVILLSSPKSIARALQRIGRSGHKLHETSKGIFIALDHDDLVECSIIKKCAKEKKIDRIKIPKNPIDVLIQHLIGMAYDELPVEEAFKIVKRCYNFSTLTREDFDETLKYLEGYQELEHKKIYGKIKIENGIIKPRKGARMIFMLNSGVIPDTSDVAVILKNKVIGFIDELFLERLNRGDVFVLGGKTYKVKGFRNMRLYVESSDGKPTVPSWFSESLPLSYDLATEILKFREEIKKRVDRKRECIKYIINTLDIDETTAEAIHNYFYEQEKYAGIPHYRKMLVEVIRDQDYVIIVHSLFGRRVNDVLSRIFAYYFNKRYNFDVRIGISDNNFMIVTDYVNDDLYFVYQDFLNSNLTEIYDLIEKTELFFRRFRHTATRSFLVLKNYRGRKRSIGKQQLATKQIYNVIKKVYPDFILFKETKREILEDLMDLENAKNAMKILRNMNFEIKRLPWPSPFGINIFMQGYSDLLKFEEKHEFVKQIHKLIMKKIKENKER